MNLLKKLDPLVVVRYVGLLCALASSFLILFFFKRNLNLGDSAFLLSAMGTSSFAIFSTLGYGKPIFYYLSKNKKDISGCTTLLFIMSFIGSLIFSVTWVVYANLDSVSIIGAFFWILSYAFSAAILPLRDIFYQNGFGDKYEFSEFVRRFGSLVSILIVSFDRSCLLSGLLNFSISFTSVAVLIGVTIKFVISRIFYKIFYNIARDNFRVAIKSMFFSLVELCFYNGPYIVLNLFSRPDTVIQYAFFQRLFQGITTFTRVPSDISIYKLLNKRYVEFVKISNTLVFRSLLVGIAAVVVLFVVRDSLSAYLLKSDPGVVIYLAVSLWVLINCVLNVYGNYVLLSGDFFTPMSRISLLMLIMLCALMVFCIEYGKDIGFIFTIAAFFYAVMTFFVYFLACKISRNITQ